MKLKQNIASVIVLFLFIISLSGSAQAINVDAAQAYNKGLDLYIAGNTNESIVQFETAIKLDPTFSDAYYNLGSIYRFNGNLEKAEEAFQKVSKLKPTDTSINYDLALIYIQKNEYPKALSFLKLIEKSSDKYQDAQSKISFIENELNPSKYLVANDKAEDDSVIINNNSSIDTTENLKNTNVNSSIDLSNTKVSIIPPSAESDLEVSGDTDKVEKLTISPRNDLAQSNSNNTYKSSKFWQQYNVSTSNDKISNANISDDENLPVTYAAIADSKPSEKLSISSKKQKNDISKGLKDNEKISKSQKRNNENIARVAVKTFATGFNGPTGMVKDSYGNFYIANYSENKIYKVSQNGEKKIFVCSDEINGPIGMAIDNANNIYVASYQSNSIVKIAPDSTITTIATGLNKPYFLYFDTSGKLYVTEQDSNSISEINLINKIGLNK